jgi:hypothetical protein
MKKLIVFGGLFVVLSLPLSAQGLYIDLGFGLGKGWTKLDGNDAMDIVDSPNGSSDFALDLGLKGGWGPFGSIPLYAVLEFEMMGHRVQNVDNYVQFNSYMIGPGVLFYPVPLIQLGLSLGYSWTGNNTDFRGMYITAAQGLRGMFPQRLIWVEKIMRVC